MAIELTGIVAKHERRIRLVFSSPLAAGAFGSPAPAQYVVDNEDGLGVSPGIQAAIIVSGATSNVELALDADLVEGALYRVTAIGIPGADLSSATSASDQHFRFGISAVGYNVEPKTQDGDALVFGRDIIFNGVDYPEDPTGDLATVTGVPNAYGALRRRLTGAPLPWARDYSPRARQYVDIPSPAIGTLAGGLQTNALRDDRVQSIKTRLVVDEETTEEAHFEVTPVFKGGKATAPIPVHVYVP